MVLTLEHKKRNEIAVRLSKIEGHVRGIRQMADEGKPCSDILLQISAVKAALHKVSVIVLEDHLEHCVLGATPDEAQTLLADMKEALSHFGR
jgi:DNA-binding FrmR family transcriptional regulator